MVARKKYIEWAIWPTQHSVFEKSPNLFRVNRHTYIIIIEEMKKLEIDWIMVVCINISSQFGMAEHLTFYLVDIKAYQYVRTA